eukprot:scaffold13071_cov93-Cylindrotheca_fusiformis.AAC.1
MAVVDYLSAKQIFTTRSSLEEKVEYGMCAMQSSRVEAGMESDMHQEFSGIRQIPGMKGNQVDIRIHVVFPIPLCRLSRFSIEQLFCLWPSRNRKLSILRISVESSFPPWGH